jgi:F-type H+-transporting ATPase subunit b
MDMIQSRQKEIDDLYADAEAAKVNANAMEEEYKNRLATAQQTGDNLVKEAMARGKNREEEIIRQANREADAIREKAAADIARDKKKALNDAKDEISSIALEIAGKVVGEAMDGEQQQRLVDKFLADLEEQA